MTTTTGPISVTLDAERQALFDGSSEEFTMTAFVRFGNTGEDMTIVSKLPYGYWIGVNDLGTHLEVWTTPSTLSLAVPLVSVGEWGHIAVTWDPGDRVIRSYQNGAFSAASASVNINFDHEEGSLTIGFPESSAGLRRALGRSPGRRALLQPRALTDSDPTARRV